MKYCIVTLLFISSLFARGISNFESKLNLGVSKNTYLSYAIGAYPPVSPSTILTRTNISRFDMQRGAIHSGIYRENGDSEQAQSAAAYLVRTSQIVQGEAGEDAYNAIMGMQVEFGLYSSLYNYLILRDTDFLSSSEKDHIEQSLYDMTVFVAENAVRDGNTTNRNGSILSGAGVNESLRVFPNQPKAAQMQGYVDAHWDNLMLIGDNDEEATHYNALGIPYQLKIAQSRGVEQDFYADPDIKNMIERFREQVSPIGIIPNFGDSYWASLWGPWVGVFEKAAVIYNEGKYRYAAQRLINYARAQSFFDNNPESNMGLIFAMEWMDESIEIEVPEVASYYSNRRYRSDVADKLVLRNGEKGNESYVHLNLYYGGLHGHPDGSAVIAYMDSLSPLLRNHNRHPNSEEYRNMLIIRDREETFPFIERQFVADKWQHTAIEVSKIRNPIGALIDLSNLASLTISSYGDEELETTFDMYVDNIRGVKADGTVIIIEDFENGLNGWNGTLTNDSLYGNHSLKRMVTLSYGSRGDISFPSTILPLDISEYETLEFNWKMTDNRLHPHWGGQVRYNSPGAQGITRSQFTTWQRNMRMPEADIVKDFDKASFAGVNTKIKDYLGGESIHRRDMLLSGKRFFWVRDQVQFLNDQSNKIGAVWHIGNIAESGDNWFRTYQDPVYEDWKAAAKDCIVYFVEQDGFDISTSSGDYDPEYAVYQYRDGEAQSGERIHFNTLFIPIDTNQSSDIVNDVSVLFDTERATAVRIGTPEKGWLASLSTSFNNYSSEQFSTDANRSFVEYDGDVKYFCAYQTTSIIKNSRELFTSSASRADIELKYDYDPAKIYSAQAEIDLITSSQISFYFPQHPSELKLNGELAEFNYDTIKKTVSLNIQSGKNTINVFTGEKVCIDKLAGDVNRDCIVDFFDLRLIAFDWLIQAENMFTDLSGDGSVNFNDFRKVADSWLAEYTEPATALWKFNESEGVIAYDYVGGYHGSAVGNFIWQPDGGVVDGAIQLLGNGGYIDVPNFALISNWHIAATIKLGSANFMMLCGDNSDGNNYIYLQGSTARFRNSSGSQVSWGLDSSLVGSWKTITFSADDLGIEVFLDGVSQGYQAISPTINLYTIGSGHTNNMYDFQGLIDEIKLYIED